MGIKVLLADDHAIVRYGLSNSIEQLDDMEVVGQSCDGPATVKLASELEPDVIIMDISMPHLDGFEATRRILSLNPNIKIIALSMYSSRRYVSEMLKAGAKGYLLKECEFEELVNAIRTVAAGKTYLSPSISDALVDNVKDNESGSKNSAFMSLTQRERQVLKLLAEGLTTKEIACKLFVSPKTVETHRLNVMNKLEINNIAQLTKYAINEGLTSSEIS